MPPKTDKSKVDKPSPASLKKTTNFLLSSGYDESQFPDIQRELHTFFLYHCSPVSTLAQAWTTFQSYKYWPEEECDRPKNRQEFEQFTQLCLTSDLLEAKLVSQLVIYYALDKTPTIDIIAENSHLDFQFLKYEGFINRLQAQYKQYSVGKENTPDRIELIKKKDELEKMIQDQENEMTKYIESDPDLIEELEDRIQLSINAANIWTENIHRLYSWFDSKSMVDGTLRHQFLQQHGLPAEFDELPNIKRKTPGKIKEGKYQINQKRPKLKKR